MDLDTQRTRVPGSCLDHAQTREGSEMDDRTRQRARDGLDRLDAHGDELSELIQAFGLGAQDPSHARRR
jgi:hypothetical protein